MGAAASPFRQAARALKVCPVKRKLGPFFVQLVTQQPDGGDRREQASMRQARSEGAAKRASLAPAAGA